MRGNKLDIEILCFCGLVGRALVQRSRGRGINAQPEALELYFSQLVPVEFENVYLSDTQIYYTLL